MTDAVEEPSILVVRRPFRLLGWALGVAIEVDGIQQGVLRSGQTRTFELPPGSHRVRSTFRRTRYELRVSLGEGRRTVVNIPVKSKRAIVRAELVAAESAGLDGRTWKHVADLVRVAHAGESIQFGALTRQTNDDRIDKTVALYYVAFLGVLTLQDLIGDSPPSDPETGEVLPEVLEPIVELAFPRWKRIYVLDREPLRECLRLWSGGQMSGPAQNLARQAAALGAIMRDPFTDLPRHRPHIQAFVDRTSAEP